MYVGFIHVSTKSLRRPASCWVSLLRVGAKAHSTCPPGGSSPMGSLTLTQTHPDWQHWASGTRSGRPVPGARRRAAEWAPVGAARGRPLQQIPGQLRSEDAGELPTRARPICFRGGAWLGEVRLEVRGGSRGERPCGWVRGRGRVGAGAWPCGCARGRGRVGGREGVAGFARTVGPLRPRTRPSR